MDPRFLEDRRILGQSSRGDNRPRVKGPRIGPGKPSVTNSLSFSAPSSWEIRNRGSGRAGSPAPELESGNKGTKPLLPLSRDVDWVERPQSQ